MNGPCSILRRLKPDRLIKTMMHSTEVDWRRTHLAECASCQERFELAVVRNRPPVEVKSCHEGRDRFLRALGIVRQLDNDEIPASRKSREFEPLVRRIQVAVKKRASRLAARARFDSIPRNDGLQHESVLDSFGPLRIINGSPLTGAGEFMPMNADACCRAREDGMPMDWEVNEALIYASEDNTKNDPPSGDLLELFSELREAFPSPPRKLVLSIAKSALKTESLAQARPIARERILRWLLSFGPETENETNGQDDWNAPRTYQALGRFLLVIQEKLEALLPDATRTAPSISRTDLRQEISRVFDGIPDSSKKQRVVFKERLYRSIWFDRRFKFRLLSVISGEAESMTILDSVLRELNREASVLEELFGESAAEALRADADEGFVELRAGRLVTTTAGRGKINDATKDILSLDEIERSGGSCSEEQVSRFMERLSHHETPTAVCILLQAAHDSESLDESSLIQLSDFAPRERIGDYRAWHWLGQFRARVLRDPEGAWVAYDAALSIEPEFVRSIVNRANLVLTRESKTDAEVEFVEGEYRRALELVSPEDSSVLASINFKLGSLLDRYKKDIEGAIKHLEEATRNAPGRLSFREKLLCALLKAKKWKRADRACLEMATLSPPVTRDSRLGIILESFAEECRKVPRTLSPDVVNALRTVAVWIKP